MLRTRENSDVFNSLDEIYLVFTSKKQISSIDCMWHGFVMFAFLRSRHGESAYIIEQGWNLVVNRPHFRSYLIGRGSFDWVTLNSAYRFGYESSMWNRAVRVFSVCGYRREFIRGHTVKLVLRDRKRFGNAYTW